MSNLGGWLLRGLCLLICCRYLKGAMVIDKKSRRFSQCSDDKNCPSNSTCERTQWGNFCICTSGFYNYNNDVTVTCPEGNCQEEAKCKGSPWLCINDAYSCGCPAGKFKSVIKQNGKNKIVCTDQDIAYCDNDDSDCPSNATCANKSCYCKKGFTSPKSVPSLKSNEVCQDIDECSNNNGNCPTNSFCENTNGNFSCVCQDGYTLHTNGSNNTCVEQTDKCRSLIPQECLKSSNAGQQCSLLEHLRQIQKSACQENNAKPSIQNVTNEISQALNQSLRNLNESSDRTVVTSLLKTVENTILTLFTQKPSNQRISTPELEISMKTSNGSCDDPSSFITLDLASNSMVVPCLLLPRENDGAVFIQYNDLESSLTQVLQNNPKEPENHRSAVINSQVVTGAVTRENTKSLNPPVTFYLRHRQDTDPSDKLECVFWDGKRWSSSGCDTKPVNSTHTLCSCSHLSSFAILMSFEEEHKVK